VARLHLVRHGQAAAGWGDDADPGLSPLGVRQAEAVAAHLAASVAPMPVRSSPLRRARATAEPLAGRWEIPIEIDAAFGEIPSPSDDLDERAAWLSSALAGRWGDLDEAVGRWRAELLAAALGTLEDRVVFTHFVAINALVGAAAGSDDVTTFLPANASVTVLEVDGGQASIVALGDEAPPEVG
jgi:broad specificity phosphatase PhoE